jgi:predicted lipoprotein with Yx(FWY)xxD motif
MNDDFSLFPDASFPVYTLSTDSGHTSACEGQCSLIWSPVLTSGPPAAEAGVDQHNLGIIVRADGTHQVTYNGKPLYLFAGDAYIQGLPYGPARINGDGISTALGTFHAIPMP